jgi:hypothetical protein
MHLARAVALLVTFAGCAFPSEGDIQSDFRSYVTSRNQCKVADDCVLVSPGCPLGCSVPVARDHKAAVEAKAHELIKSYERGGRACAYACVPQGPPICSAGRCAFNPEPAQLPPR